jgi:hypothetical protein
MTFQFACRKLQRSKDLDQPASERSEDPRALLAKRVAGTQLTMNYEL